MRELNAVHPFAFPATQGGVGIANTAWTQNAERWMWNLSTFLGGLLDYHAPPPLMSTPLDPPGLYAVVRVGQCEALGKG